MNVLQLRQALVASPSQGRRQKYKAEFRRLADDADSAVADAARDALRVLEARQEAAASG